MEVLRGALSATSRFSGSMTTVFMIADEVIDALNLGGSSLFFLADEGKSSMHCEFRLCTCAWDHLVRVSGDFFGSYL